MSLARWSIRMACDRLGYVRERCGKLPILVSQDISYLFLHAPKCGGTSIVDTFAANGFDIELQIRGKPPQECLTVSPQHQICSALRSLLRFENISDIFIVARNPYQRVLSEYNWAFRDVPAQERMAYSDWVVQELAKAAANESYADNHFRPILDFIDPSMPTRVFRLEDRLEAIIEFYLQPVGALKNIPVYHKKKTLSFKHHSLNCELDGQALFAINNFYRNDFAAFGYPLLPECADMICQKSSTESIDDLKTLAKIEAVRRWRAETLRILQIKLQAQLDFLCKAIGDIDHLAFANCASGTINDTSAVATYQRFYENLNFRLECLDRQLECLQNLIVDRDNFFSVDQMVGLIVAFRSRIEDLSALDAS